MVRKGFWLARCEERATLILAEGTPVETRVELHNVAVLGVDDPRSFPPVAFVPIDLIPEEARIATARFMVEVEVVSAPPQPRTRRAIALPNRRANHDDLDEAFG
jgi:hypothetical protein